MKQYKEYKDSGIAWIGAIPSHWQVVIGKRIYSANDSGVWGNDPNGENDTIVLRSTEQAEDGTLKIINPARRQLSAEEQERKKLIVGDLIITKSSGSSSHIGKTSLIDKETEELGCCYSNFIQRIRIKGNSKFYWYVFNSQFVRIQFQNLATTTTGLGNLSQTLINHLLLPLPPAAEQEAIVKYLDKKTEQINQYITLQEQQIQGLQELKQSIIARAVTRGLDPKAPLRPSGIAWIGDIPCHWQVKRLKKQINFINGYAFDSNLFKIDGDTPVIRIGDIVDGKISYNNTIGVNYNSSLSSFEIKPNDILIAMSGATVGKTGIASFSDRGYINQRVGIIRTQKYRYIYYALNSNKFEQYIQLKSNGAAQPNISSSLIQDYPITLPPLEEQEAIVKYLDEKTEQINLLISKTEASIALMKEFKQSLIADAVTGRINVQPA